METTAPSRIVVRPLTPEEYPRLSVIEEGVVPDPSNSIVVIAEDSAGVICGRMLLVVMPHLEGTWVAPTSRSGRIGFKMERVITDEARAIGLKKIMAFTTNEQHTQYLERLGWSRENLTVLSKEL